MNNDIKYVSGDFDKESGKSTVILKYKNKLYSGEAYLHPSDIGYGSTYTGCTIAEIRATIEVLKDKINEAKAEYKVCKNFVSACSCYNKFNAEDPSAKAVFRQLNRKKANINKLYREIENLKEQEKTIIDARDKYIQKRKQAEYESKEVNE